MINSTSTVNRHELLQEEIGWVTRVRNGDEEAMDRIVSKHRQRLIRVASNILRDRHEAEDMAQDAFLKAFREIHKLRDDKAFSGYLYRICVRLCMDRLRSKKPTSELMETGHGGTDQKIETKILIERLLELLNPELRTTLILREMEELSYDEVAAVMNVPVGTVRSRLHAARERFRAIYQDAIEESN